MSIRLEAIAFNHDPTSATSDAFNIRRSAAIPVAVPEWQRGVSFAPGDSVAAYAINEVQGNTITIQVNFSSADPELKAVEIRAVNPFLPQLLESWFQSLLTPPVAWTTNYYYYWQSYYFWEILNAAIGNILGEVQPSWVTFNSNGETGFTAYKLESMQLWNRGVGVHTVLWLWQFRRSSEEHWTDFATSSHRIYTVLEVPKEPWRQDPFHPANLQLPWTEVLDYACRWAQGADKLNDAAAAVTREVYALGPELIEYGCLILGLTQYAIPEGYFNCTAFLERLHGGIGNGRYVNCTDCATIVSTFANCLGCELSQSRMGMIAPFFPINPVLAIGSNVWQPACGLPGFFYHEVAWQGACTANDAVFDACLQIDGDLDPTREPHTPVLPANMPFGEPGEGEYRDRLATPQGSFLCEPQPSTRRRRLVF